MASLFSICLVGGGACTDSWEIPDWVFGGPHAACLFHSVGLLPLSVIGLLHPRSTPARHFVAKPPKMACASGVSCLINSEPPSCQIWNTRCGRIGQKFLPVQQGKQQGQGKRRQAVLVLRQTHDVKCLSWEPRGVSKPAKSCAKQLHKMVCRLRASSEATTG